VGVGQQHHEVTQLQAEPVRVRAYSWSLLALAVGAGISLAIAGAAVPTPGPVLLLALALALCVNRFAFFSSEQAATAEAAVLVAAVVGFRSDAAWLGPLAVALLVGPLDALHLSQRSYVRMAYNAGNRALSALAATAAFLAVSAGGGSSALLLTAAVVTAAIAFAAVDTVLSAVLLTLQGDRPRDALRHLIEIDALTVPLALYGAAAGFLAGELGWWATALALVPAAFLPELVLARARWRGRDVRNATVAVVVVACFGVSACFVPVPGFATLAVLAAVGVLAGGELACSAGVRVPPMVALVVIASLAVVAGDGAFFAAALVAVVTTLSSWSASAIPRRSRFGPLALAAAGALSASAVFGAAPGSRTGVVVATVVAGVVFEVVVALGSPRRRRLADVTWTLPIIALAATASLGLRAIGVAALAPFTAVMVVALGATAWFGAPPWTSRVLGAWGARWAPTRHERAVVVLAGAAAIVLMVAPFTGGPALRPVLVSLGVGMGELLAATSMVGVRQWRFAPHRRRTEAGVVLYAAVGLAVAYPALAAVGRGWAGAVGVVLVVTISAIGRRHAARSDASSPAVPVGSLR
jgi:hypothetical protein